ncbi:MAG: phage holin family protein [Ignavibacteria bacterium]|nr:phage holin family protein [Ignavibacteria bacterium]
MRLLLIWLVNSVAIFGTAALLPGITIRNFTTAIMAAVVLGLLNAVLKPVLAFFSFPFILLTFGLFSLLINGVVLWICAGILDGFEIRGFGSAILGAIIISCISWFLSMIFGIK